MNVNKTKNEIKTNNQPKLALVACADLHLSPKPPIARSSEEDWLAYQAGQLDQLRSLVVSPTGEQKIPLVIVGDIFDSYRVDPATINVALSHLPKIYSVYGNHDLPNHDPSSLHRSPYWTLVKAGKAIPLEANQPLEIPCGKQPIRLHGFPFGCPVQPLKEPFDLYLEIAVIHDFLWIKGCGYQGAPQDKRLKGRWDKLAGFDVALFGDNHIPFDVKPTRSGIPYTVNCGGFFRRKKDEIKHRPSAVKVFTDGSIERHYLDVSKDKFLDYEELEKTLDGVGSNTVIESLMELGDSALDFVENVQRVLRRDKVSEEVKRLIRTFLGLREKQNNKD